MGQINNDLELYNQLGGAINVAIEYVMDKIYKEYDSLIEEIVYDLNGIGNAYERTYTFRDSWDYNVTKNIRGASGQLYQDLDAMDLDPDNFVHGSNYWNMTNVRPIMAEILYEGLSGDLFGQGWWQRPRDAWTPLIDKLNGGQLDIWFREGMKKSGISLTRIS